MIWVSLCACCSAGLAAEGGDRAPGESNLVSPRRIAADPPHDVRSDREEWHEFDPVVVHPAATQSNPSRDSQPATTSLLNKQDTSQPHVVDMNSESPARLSSNPRGVVVGPTGSQTNASLHSQRPTSGPWNKQEVSRPREAEMISKKPRRLSSNPRGDVGSEQEKWHTFDPVVVHPATPQTDALLDSQQPATGPWDKQDERQPQLVDTSSQATGRISSNPQRELPVEKATSAASDPTVVHAAGSQTSASLDSPDSPQSMTGPVGQQDNSQASEFEMISESPGWLSSNPRESVPSDRANWHEFDPVVVHSTDSQTNATVDSQQPTAGSWDKQDQSQPHAVDMVLESPGWLFSKPQGDEPLGHEKWRKLDPIFVNTAQLQGSLSDAQEPAEAQPSDELLDLGFQSLLDSLDPSNQPKTGDQANTAPTDRTSERIPAELEAMVQRIDELEAIIQANEDATRTIIRQTFSEQASKINEFVTFGGTFELLTTWEEDFDGETISDIVLDTAQLDFEIQVNSWTLGSLIFEYDDGSNLLFPTTTGNNAFVDRINVDTAFITIGDTQRFCLYTTLGRVITPFGISTGAAKGQVLNLIDPLTVEMFETRQDVILIGMEGPTPPPPPPVSTTPVPPPPKVKPLLLNPLVSRFSRCLGYCPPPPPRPPTPVPALWVPKRPPYKGEIYFYNGEVNDGGFDHIEHMGGTLSIFKEGKFRRCLPIIAPQPNAPWSMDFAVNVTSSVFDSRLLEFEYREFLEEIGYVPGMAAHVSSAFGPLSLIVEWNGAVSNATFVDDADELIDITPGAWQVSLGYQFDWNPQVIEVGAQGTYFAIGYSESYDLAGFTQVIDLNPFHPPNPEETLRTGFVPNKRFVVGVGEWVLDGLRVAFEYSRVVDYPEGEGLGTGNSADAILGVVTYEW